MKLIYDMGVTFNNENYNFILSFLIILCDANDMPTLRMHCMENIISCKDIHILHEIKFILIMG